MNRSKGARLELKRNPGRQTVWIIRDGAQRISTGCLEHDREAADKKLARYILTKPTEAEVKRERNPDNLLCATVLNHYARERGPQVAVPANIGYKVQALLPFWAKRPLSDVISSNCTAYAAHRQSMTFQGRPISSGTINNEFNTLQAAINFWARDFGLTHAPRVTRIEHHDKRERVLERSELARLLREARRRQYKHLVRFLMIARYTGTRQEAICKLRWIPSVLNGHVDSERGILYRMGAGERQTKKRRPPCAIHPKLLWFLRHWQAADMRQGQTYVIHSRGEPIRRIATGWSKSEPQTPWAIIVEAAGLAFEKNGRLTSDVTPHVLRHTCATWALWEGQGLWDVSELIGATPTMIQEVYGHARLAVQARAARAKGKTASNARAV